MVVDDDVSSGVSYITQDTFLLDSCMTDTYRSSTAIMGLDFMMNTAAIAGMVTAFTVVKKGKGVCKLFMEIHLTATECHLPYGITQCYLPPDTSEHTPPLRQPERLVLNLPTI